MGTFNNKNKKIASLFAATLLSSTAFAEEVVVSGLLEAELVVAEDYAKNKVTDITAATAEIGIDAAVSDQVDAHVLMLFEEDESEAALIDEASITLNFSDNFSATLGKVYVPFGVFDSNMISDPLTLELGETNESVIQLGFSFANTYGSVYTFNGDSARITDTDDNVMSYGLNIGFNHNDIFDASLGYLSNMAETDALQALDGGGLGIPGLIKDDVAGMSVSASIIVSHLKIIIEHVQALDDFVVGDFNALLVADTSPSASNLEFAVKNYDIVYAVAYQKTEDALFLDLPEEVISAAISFPLIKGADMAIEYAQINDYGVADGGTGEDASQFTIQVSTGF
jgi:hypothetical protein